MRSSLLLVPLLALGTPAVASDGRLEIHQACVATGCFPGDSPGFPVTITNAGSYVLTSNLAVSSSSVTAISGTSDVSIDLNGFTISGVTSCTGAPAVCTGAGSGRGIVLSDRASVRNGTVRGMGDIGIVTTGGSVVENVTVSGNGGDGIALSGAGNQVLDCRVLQNGDDGISLYFIDTAASIVRGNTIHGNAGYGADLIRASAIDNIVASNGDEGLYMITATAFYGNKVSDNNGGNANSQILGGLNLGENVCGTTLCP